MVPQFYLGTIVATARTPGEYGDLLTQAPEFHEAVCDIPGVVSGIKAFPKSNGADEPRIGDPVLLCSFDPTYNSYFVYEVLKESDFIGFRASGKMVDLTPGAITIGVFDQNADFSRGVRPDCSALAHVTISDAGAIDIHAASDITVQADANITINCSGNASVTISGNCDLNVSGNCNVKAGGTLETDGGTWKTTNGVAVPSGNGPFCGIPYCPFTGAPQSGQQC
jgi:hypothetical protein